MPILTFYAFIGRRHNRMPIKTIADWPTDWQHLKDLLVETAEKVFCDYKQSVTPMTLERHLPGKFVIRFGRGRYSQHRVRFRRDVEFSCQMSYNQRTREIRVNQGMFSFHLMLLSSDYYAERGIRWRTGPIIPRMHQNVLGNTKSLIMEPSGVRYADYSKRPRDLYGGGRQEEKLERQKYEPSCEREYLPHNLRIREENNRL